MQLHENPSSGRRYTEENLDGLYNELALKFDRS